MAAQTVPMTMQRELTAGMKFLRSIISQSRKLQSTDLDRFVENLTRLLCKKYTGHWFPEHPMRERDYRCISSDRDEEDINIREACRLSKLQYKDLSLPRVFTLWIDPCEVSCRLGMTAFPFTVALFDPLPVPALTPLSSNSEVISGRTEIQHVEPTTYMWVTTDQGRWWTPISRHGTRVSFTVRRINNI
ncbi:protein BTG3-like [Hyperolius riggenbachi]|uniref:protein BTG3-like n=1 Tax=Hyperolius riggenbachi TaxID=752182 RepID=UPI0035A2DDCE